MRPEQNPSRDTRYFRFEKRKNDKGDEVEVQLGTRTPYVQPSTMLEAFGAAEFNPDNMKLAHRVLGVMRRNTKRSKR